MRFAKLSKLVHLVVVFSSVPIHKKSLVHLESCGFRVWADIS